MLVNESGVLMLILVFVTGCGTSGFKNSDNDNSQ
jgi:hypothetical protein